MKLNMRLNVVPALIPAGCANCATRRVTINAAKAMMPEPPSTSPVKDMTPLMDSAATRSVVATPQRTEREQIMCKAP